MAPLRASARENVALVDALRFAVLEFDNEDARQAGEIRADLATMASPSARMMH
jgi:predicted nucleic acid-binding protein